MSDHSISVVYLEKIPCPVTVVGRSPMPNFAAEDYNVARSTDDPFLGTSFEMGVATRCSTCTVTAREEHCRTKRPIDVVEVEVGRASEYRNLDSVIVCNVLW